ncbi:MAG: protein-S-isoprenylcysteine methyltransferase [Bacteroidota bacterium]
MKFLLIAFLWAGYCALHSYLISIGFTSLMTRLLKKYYAFYRVFYILVSLFLLIPLIKFTGQLDNQVIIVYGHYMDILRDILVYGSLIMFFWAFFFDYDSLSFFGIRQIMNFAKTTEKNPSNEIKKRGLLGIMRHPMYFALIIYLWCHTSKMSDIVVNIVLTVYIIIGTILEEKKLVLEFGEAYIRYQREVPMIIPFTKMKAKAFD